MSIGFVSCLKKYYKFGRQISKYLHCEDLVLLHEPEVQDFKTERELFQTHAHPTWQQGLHQSHLYMPVQKACMYGMQSKGIPLYWQPFCL